MSPQLDPAFTQAECNIRALTTAIQIIQPGRGASEPPVPSAQKDHIALSKAYNHLAILLTQGLEAEDGAGRQVVAVTGKVSDSRLSVCAITEIEKLPSLSSVTFTRNPRNEEEQQGRTLIHVIEIQKSGTPLQDLADPIQK